MLLLSMLPAVAMVAHWSWPDSIHSVLAEASSAAEAPVTASHEQRGVCQTQRPCADASVHGSFATSWVSRSSIESQLAESTVVPPAGGNGDLVTQSAVSPDPFPPRYAVS